MNLTNRAVYITLVSVRQLEFHSRKKRLRELIYIAVYITRVSIVRGCSQVSLASFYVKLF